MPKPKGFHYSEESRAKMRAKAIGRIHTEEWKAKMREKNSGSGNPFFGKHHSEETKAKIRAKNSGRPCSTNTKESLRKRKRESSSVWKGDEAKPHSGNTRAKRWFECPKGMQRHHIDGNPLNNSPENIMFVTPKQHRAFHKGSYITEKGRAKHRAVASARLGEKHPLFGKHLSDATKAKLRERMMGDKNPFFGRHHTELTKAKIREGQLRRKAKDRDKLA